MRDVAGDGGLPAISPWQDAGVLRAGFAVPAGERPEDRLREQADAVGDPALRGELCAALDRLEEHRHKIAAAMTAPAELEAALDRLDQEFSRLTGREPSRDKHRADAGRLAPKGFPRTNTFGQRP